MQQLHKLFAWIAVALTLACAKVQADEASILRRIEALGGEVTRDETRTGRPIVAVQIYSVDTTNADIEEVAKLKHLTRLFLCRGEATPACVHHLEKLTELKDL